MNSPGGSTLESEWPIDLAEMRTPVMLPLGSPLRRAWEAVIEAIGPLSDVEKARVLNATAIIYGVDQHTRIATIVANIARPRPKPAIEPTPIKPTASEPRRRQRKQNRCSVCRKPGHIYKLCPVFKRQQSTGEGA